MTEELRRGYHIEVIPAENQAEINAVQPEGVDIPDIAGDANQTGETLLIDGEPTPYIRTDEGYRIFYQPPAPTLLEAARDYVDTQREKAQ